jgi:hypothetical protein
MRLEVPVLVVMAVGALMTGLVYLLSRLVIGTAEAMPESNRLGPWLTALANARLLIASTFFTVLIVGAVVATAAGSWWVLVGAVVLHLIATLVVVGIGLEMASETGDEAPERLVPVEPGSDVRLQQDGAGRRGPT